MSQVKTVEFKERAKPKVEKSPEEVAAELKLVRESLPIYTERATLLDAVQKNPNLIVVGETGSGKTTQLPQYLYEAGFANKGRMIACTQPRRVAAITVAKRVSEEMGCKLGSTVGYTIRFEDVSSRDTKIKYLTDGMLLREIQIDPHLRRYSVVLLDEAHERSLNTDILFALLKRLQKSTRPDLKVIAMSATLDAGKFSSYFFDAPVAIVAGRTFDVDVNYCESVQTDYVESAVVTVMQLHQEKPLDGDILVFLPGSEEIENAIQAIRERTKLLPHNAPGILAVPLYSALAPEQQLAAFAPTPRDQRKVVVSTNIAETSVTLSGIKYVVDSGMSKVRRFIAATGIERLQVEPVSKAEAWQRAGRSGRERAGECYRLYSETDFLALNLSVTPEIMRVPLTGVVLTLKALNVDDVLGFDFIDRPGKRAIREAVKELIALSALDDTLCITELGKKMTRLPLDPAYSKVLIASASPPDAVFAPCSSEMASLVAALSAEQIFVDISRLPANLATKASAVRKQFMNQDGDLMGYLDIVTNYLKQKETTRYNWARERFLNTRTMEHIVRIRQQLVDELEALDLPVVSCAGSTFDSMTKDGKLSSSFSISAFSGSAGGAADLGGGSGDNDDDENEGGRSKHSNGKGKKQGGAVVVGGSIGSISEGGVQSESGETKASLEAVRRCLVSGLFMRAAKRQYDGSYKTADNTVVHIHPSSMLCTFRDMLSTSQWQRANVLARHQQAAIESGTSNIVSSSASSSNNAGGMQSVGAGFNDLNGSGRQKHPFDCLLFTELLVTTKTFMRNVVVVDWAWLAELAPRAFQSALGAHGFGGAQPVSSTAAAAQAEAEAKISGAKVANSIQIRQDDRPGGAALSAHGAVASVGKSSTKKTLVIPSVMTSLPATPKKAGPIMSSIGTVVVSQQRPQQSQHAGAHRKFPHGSGSTPNHRPPQFGVHKKQRPFD